MVVMMCVTLKKIFTRDSIVLQSVRRRMGFDITAVTRCGIRQRSLRALSVGDLSDDVFMECLAYVNENYRKNPSLRAKDGIADNMGPRCVEDRKDFTKMNYCGPSL